MDVERLLQEATTHHQSGRMRDAETLYRQILQHDPDQPDVLNLMGLLAHAAGRRDAALGYFARAVSLRPDNAAWHHNFAECWLAINELDQAIAAYRKSIALEPARPETRASLAIALARRGLLDQAIEQFDQAFSLNF